jgi:integrase
MGDMVGGESRETRTKHTSTRNRRSPFSKFEYAISSEQTRDYYYRKLKAFIDFLDLESSSSTDNLEESANNLYHLIQKEGTEWFSDCLVDYIAMLKVKVGRREIVAGTLRNYFKPIKLFCDMNDILLNWKMISRGIPSGKRASMDRAPTIQEIHKLLEFAHDERVKPLVLVMVSTGIRLGAWEYLKWKHVTPLYNSEGVLIAAKLIVYAGEPEQYYTFMTPEAYLSLKEWMDFRSSFGEKISGESWLLRDKWQTTHTDYGGRYGMGAAPKKISTHSIRNLLQHIYFKQNIRKPLEKGQKNHEFKTMHGFRKYYKTVCEGGGMKPANVELLIGHDLGLSQSYYKPTESQLLEDYLKVVNLLTVDKAFKLEQKLLEKQRENDIYRQQLSKMDQRIDDIQRLLSAKSNNTLK